MALPAQIGQPDPLGIPRDRRAHFGRVEGDAVVLHLLHESLQDLATGQVKLVLHRGVQNDGRGRGCSAAIMALSRSRIVSVL